MTQKQTVQKQQFIDIQNNPLSSCIPKTTQENNRTHIFFTISLANFLKVGNIPSISGMRQEIEISKNWLT